MGRKFKAWDRVGTGLALFGIGLGVMEIVAPGKLAKVIGSKPSDILMRTFGTREIGSGLAILRSDSNKAGLWSRVGGDALDIGALGLALLKSRGSKAKIASSLVSVLGVTALDYLAARNAGTRTKARGAVSA